MPLIRGGYKCPRLHVCCYRIWCIMPWLLVVGGQVQGSRLCVRYEGCCSSSWWWAYKCPKHVEQIIIAINHSIASSWVSSLRIYNDARTNIHQHRQFGSSTPIFETLIGQGPKSISSISDPYNLCLLRGISVLSLHLFLGLPCGLFQDFPIKTLHF